MAGSKDTSEKLAAGAGMNTKTGVKFSLVEAREAQGAERPPGTLMFADAGQGAGDGIEGVDGQNRGDQG